MRKLMLVSAGFAAIACSAFAQDDDVQEVPMPAIAADAAAPQAAGAENGQTTDEAASDDAEPNADELASSLNGQQQIRQTFTVKRTVNGEVVETATREVDLSAVDALRATEAGQTLAEAVRASFDRELLTRTEAFEEAKLDFALGDINLDRQMDEEEFVRLVRLLRTEIEENRPGDAAQTLAPRDAFIADLDAANARQIFQSMSGEAVTLDERGFILGFLKEFDTADANADGLLTGAELTAFRSAIKGWSKS